MPSWLFKCLVKDELLHTNIYILITLIVLQLMNKLRAVPKKKRTKIITIKHFK